MSRQFENALLLKKKIKISGERSQWFGSFSSIVKGMPLNLCSNLSPNVFVISVRSGEILF